jgi:hypothetical protein
VLRHVGKACLRLRFLPPVIRKDVDSTPEAGTLLDWRGVSSLPTQIRRHLASPSCPSNIERVRFSIGSLVSAVATACFAWSSITLGALPGCTAPGSPAQATQQHEPSHQHPHRPGNDAPAPLHCVVHLCCVQLTAPPTATLAAADFLVPDGAAGFAAVKVSSAVRPAHVLPFAHAPPHA